MGCQYLAAGTGLGVGKKRTGEHFFCQTLLLCQPTQLILLLTFLANKVFQLRHTFGAAPLHGESHLPALGAPGIVPVGSQAQFSAIAAAVSNDSARLVVVLRQNFVLRPTATKWAQVVARNEKLAREILPVPISQTIMATPVSTVTTSQSQFLYRNILETQLARLHECARSNFGLHILQQ
jgi:hypothetical protein